MPQAFARLARALPMRPMPMMPSVCPVTEVPRFSKMPIFIALPSVRNLRSHSVTRRAVSSKRAKARLAVGAVTGSGVLATVKPFASA
ncbi:hypothetical protein Barb6_02159 [Bacteroidales bacterium Barb6]|nr:hypothetical protein Barb6_02159 [Bacteroidales bacterium Barb6]